MTDEKDNPAAAAPPKGPEVFDDLMEIRLDSGDALSLNAKAKIREFYAKVFTELPPAEHRETPWSPTDASDMARRKFLSDFIADELRVLGGAHLPQPFPLRPPVNAFVDDAAAPAEGVAAPAVDPSLLMTRWNPLTRRYDWPMDAMRAEFTHDPVFNPSASRSSTGRIRGGELDSAEIRERFSAGELPLTISRSELEDAGIAIPTDAQIDPLRQVVRLPPVDPPDLSFVGANPFRPAHVRLDPPGELAPADELVPAEPLALTVFADGAPVPGPLPPVFRAALEDLPLAQVRAAVAKLEADRVPPTRDGTYHLHIATVAGALLVYAGRVRDCPSWSATRRALARLLDPARRPQGPSDDLPRIAARATEAERAQVVAHVRRGIWKPLARRRRQARKARRGWA